MVSYLGLMKHILITGGSSGIGLSIAEIFVTEYLPHLQQLTIVARDKRQLEKAQKHLEQLIETAQNKYSNGMGAPKPKVHVLSLDVSVASDVSTKIAAYIHSFGTPTMLFNVAGTSAAGAMEDTDIATYHHLMNVNYFGSVNITKSLLPHMKKQRAGAIAFTSSAAGQIGLFGYTAYSPTKFALRGLAEALAMEVRPYNISVTVVYPADTDTPGYSIENEPGKKPKETILLEQSAGLFQPTDVARKVVSATVKGSDSVWFGLEGWMLTTLTAGMSPVASFADALSQVFLMSLLRFVSLFYLMDFDNQIRKCNKESVRDDMKTR
jgi:3-dehydrosphinganine reductase